GGFLGHPATAAPIAASSSAAIAEVARVRRIALKPTGSRLGCGAMRCAPWVSALLALAFAAPAPAAAKKAKPIAVPTAHVPAAVDPRLAGLAPMLGEARSEMVVDAEDTVLDVAYRNRLGFDRIARLNPNVNVWIPDPGAVVRLPTEHVLPDGPWRGLVVNVP